jgi:Fe-S cluster biogenesis protein NfuA
VKKTEEKINELLDKVRPYIEMHGGDVQLLRVEDDTAVLKIHGACVNCELANVTYNKTVGPLIMKEVEEIKNVEFE